MQTVVLYLGHPFFRIPLVFCISHTIHVWGNVWVPWIWGAIYRRIPVDHSAEILVHTLCPLGPTGHRFGPEWSHRFAQGGCMVVWRARFGAVWVKIEVDSTIWDQSERALGGPKTHTLPPGTPRQHFWAAAARAHLSGGMCGSLAGSVWRLMGENRNSQHHLRPIGSCSGRPKNTHFALWDPQATFLGCGSACTSLGGGVWWFGMLGLAPFG